MGRVEVYRVCDDNGVPLQPERYGWRLIVKGRTIAGDTHQGYRRRADAIDMAERVCGGHYADATVTVLAP